MRLRLSSNGRRRRGAPTRSPPPRGRATAACTTWSCLRARRRGDRDACDRPRIFDGPAQVSLGAERLPQRARVARRAAVATTAAVSPRRTRPSSHCARAGVRAAPTCCASSGSRDSTAPTTCKPCQRCSGARCGSALSEASWSGDDGGVAGAVPTRLPALMSGPARWAPVLAPPRADILTGDRARARARGRRRRRHGCARGPAPRGRWRRPADGAGRRRGAALLRPSNRGSRATLPPAAVEVLVVAAPRCRRGKRTDRERAAAARPASRTELGIAGHIFVRAMRVIVIPPVDAGDLMDPRPHAPDSSTERNAAIKVTLAGARARRGAFALASVSLPGRCPRAADRAAAGRGWSRVAAGATVCTRCRRRLAAIPRGRTAIRGAWCRPTWSGGARVPPAGRSRSSPARRRWTRSARPPCGARAKQ